MVPAKRRRSQRPANAFPASRSDIADIPVYTGRKYRNRFLPKAQHHAMAERAHWHRVGDKLAEGGRIHTNLEGRPVCARAGACTGSSGSCKKSSGILSGILTRMCVTQISVLRHQGKLFCIDSMCYHGLTRHVPSLLEKKNECMILFPCSIFPGTAFAAQCRRACQELNSYAACAHACMLVDMLRSFIHFESTVTRLVTLHHGCA